MLLQTNMSVEAVFLFYHHSYVPLRGQSPFQPVFLQHACGSLGDVTFKGANPTCRSWPSQAV